MLPEISEIVLYCMDHTTADRLNHNRGLLSHHLDPIRQGIPIIVSTCYPMIVLHHNDDNTLNGQIVLDGPHDVTTVVNVPEGNDLGTWRRRE